MLGLYHVVHISEWSPPRIIVVVNPLPWLHTNFFFDCDHRPKICRTSSYKFNMNPYSMVCRKTGLEQTWHLAEAQTYLPD